MKPRYLIACLFILVLYGCSLRPVAPPSPLAILAPEDVPVFSDDMDMASLDTAVGRSLAYLEKASDERFRFGGCEYNAAEIRESLLTFREIIRSMVRTETPANLATSAFVYSIFSMSYLLRSMAHIGYRCQCLSRLRSHRTDLSGV